MPNRMVRDGILDSERMARLSWGAEVFYRRLMSIVDDYGRYHANLVLLKARMYPLQQGKVSDQDIEGWIAECSALDGEDPSLISSYMSGGKRYLQINNFGQPIRSKSKFPAPPEAPTLASASKCEQMLTNANTTHSTTHSTTHKGFSKEEGAGRNQESKPGPKLVDKPTVPLIAAHGFEDFWFPYCEQTGKPVTEEDREYALVEWGKLSMEDKMRAVRHISSYVAEANPSHPKFFKSPAAYLKARLWTAVTLKPPRSEPKGIRLEDIA